MIVRPVPFFSGALFSRKSCFVALPEDYETSGKRYPVVYLLHGKFGCESSWLEKGAAAETLDRLIGEGKLKECIAVMPNDGEYGHGTFYVDWYDGTGNFGQYIMDDLIPFIDAHFRTIAERSGRALAGYSMGGFGAFLLALRHPEHFSAAASLSGALGALSRLPYREYSRSDFARMLGPQAGPYAAQHDLYVLAAQRVDDENRPELYFDCGKEDELLPLNALYREHLRAIGYPHEYREYPGGHDWEYWKMHLADALQFLDRRLSGPLLREAEI